jgi:Rrf2 family transcriptional regulator, cysteine metabolism repressor
MFSITTKTRYGLLAAMELAKYYGQELVQIKDMVQRHNIPKNYLEQILNRLTKTGIITSVRGSRGGYVLGRAPGNITLLDLMDALEGEIRLSEAASDIKVVKAVFDEVEQKIRKALSITLLQLVENQQSAEQQISFDI